MDDSNADCKNECRELVYRIRQQLLGEVQMLLAAYNVRQQVCLELLRKEIDRLFLEGKEE